MMDHVEQMDRGTVHTMAGIPTWMAIGGVAATILLSHLMLHMSSRSSTSTAGWRVGLFRFTWLKALIRTPYFPMIVQGLSVMLLLLIISAGLWGSQRHNIATVLTWTWWWALLIFVILVVGKGFCTICPWEGLASLTSSLSLRSRAKKLGFELKWPRGARNLYPALGFFILLTWFELGYDVTGSPSFTAVMGVTMAALAIISALVFEKRAFCRYACLIGRISGLYSMFSPVELRPKLAAVCGDCHTVECVKGSDTATGCPTHLFPGNLQENTYCTLCTECIRACPHDNLDLNLRKPATDLLAEGKRYRWDEAVMALVLLALTSFHGMTMTAQWDHINDWLRVHTGMGPLVIFTGLMILLIILPLVVFWGSASLSRLLSGRSVERAQILKAFAYAVIPVALFYHLAHNGMHFFMEAQAIVPLLSDPFGYGWNLFGTAGLSYGPLLSLESIWWIQIAFILIGHVYAVRVADHMGRAVFAHSKKVLPGLVPFIGTMVLYSGLSIWLIAQPMVMRSGM